MGDKFDDWVGKDGRQYLQNEMAKRGKKPYNYCVENWCVAEEDSLFSGYFYDETFDDYDTCSEIFDEESESQFQAWLDLQAGSALVEYCEGNSEKVDYNMCMEEAYAASLLGEDPLAAATENGDADGDLEQLNTHETEYVCDVDTVCKYDIENDIDYPFHWAVCGKGLHGNGCVEDDVLAANDAQHE